ncbi:MULTISPECIES: DUF4112 domain-containing protein [Haloferax]|uniref:DUF4112 domain-containing protein n=1 Tax=Haloferax marinum TaxID=2666143 RepID=A0A6A8G993_9EURY|nr:MULTISPECIES: DUF4112 domain-containing protein [Haloferax]KAB1198106.1 DUF4112 domain-containing protein [Haloferax sp. CBA1150]MRW97178.1 DUF4112 domain-containing protein [Haloferax marinum]
MDDSTYRYGGERSLEPDAIVDFDDATPEDTLDRLRTVSYYLDNAIAIPGTNYRIGLDPILGLVPGIGDTTASAMSAYILVEAAMLGVPRATLARMFGNVLLDTVFGSIPLVGDVFDAAWKANTRNVRLLEERYGDFSGEGVEADRRVILVAVAVITVLLVALGVGITLAALWALGQFGVF